MIHAKFQKILFSQSYFTDRNIQIFAFFYDFSEKLDNFFFLQKILKLSSNYVDVFGNLYLRTTNLGNFITKNRV